ncbi:MAG: HlyC/CorC family transporter [Clostridiales bacterium]|nr:HlyC/CorC family transporter [Clostridiales bacterium]
MDDSSPIWGIIIFVVFLIINAVMYGFGEGIQNLNESDARKKAEEGDRSFIRLIHIIDKPSRYIQTILVVSTAMSIILGVFEYQVLLGYLDEICNLIGIEIMNELMSILIIAVPALILLLIFTTFGILIPKRLAVKYPEWWTYKLMKAVFVIIFIFRPIIFITTGVTNLVLRLFKINPHEEFENVTEEEIMFMVNEGHEQGVLLASEAEMITNIFELGEKQAQDIMTHRKNIVAIDGEWNLKETIDFILNQYNSRFPVYEKDIDNIIGILHLKDALICYEQQDDDFVPIKEIAGLLREAVFIPETRDINLLFREMQSKKIHMEIVVDEYGQTAGLIAMEDILEEIVGNIFDEYDQEEHMIIPQERGSYLMQGMTHIEDICDLLSIEFDDEEFDTLNGFLISKLDRIPQDGESMQIDYEGYSFLVLKVENKMIQLIKVSKIEELEDEILSKEDD